MSSLPTRRLLAPARTRRHDEAYDWRHHLPPDWRDQVVVPWRFVCHRDAELSAERVFGYDLGPEPCFYAHRWALHETRSDDDETFYAQPTAGESVVAWQLRDGRWLIRRHTLAGDHGAPQRPVFVFSETMPR